MTLLLLMLLGCTSDDVSDTANANQTLMDLYALTDDGLFPEGVSFHESERAFFVSSLTSGALIRIDADGTESVVFQPDGAWMSLGVQVSPEGEVVVCAITDQGTEQARSEIWAFDAKSGERTSVVDLSQAYSPTNCNDVTFHDGNVLVTDREAPNLYTVSLASQSAEIWMTDPELAPELIGQNGILVSGDILLVGKYSPGRLLRIPLDGSQTPVDVSLNIALGAVLDGPDGMAWDGDEIVMAANNLVYRISTSDDWVTATATKSELGIAISALTVAEGQIYGLQGEVVPFVLGLDPALPFALHAMDF